MIIGPYFLLWYGTWDCLIAKGISLFETFKCLHGLGSSKVGTKTYEFVTFAMQDPKKNCSDSQSKAKCTLGRVREANTRHLIILPSILVAHLRLYILNT